MNIFFYTYNLHFSLTELQPSLSSLCIKLSNIHFPTKYHFPGKKREEKKRNPSDYFKGEANKSHLGKQIFNKLRTHCTVTSY